MGINIISTELYQGIQVVHVLGVLVGLIVLMGIWNAFARRNTLGNTSGHLVARKCHSCGWSGKVGARATLCPRCNKALA